MKREIYSRLIEKSMNPCKAAWNLINSQRKKDPKSVCSASPDEVNNCFVQALESIVGGRPDKSEEL